MTAYKQLYQEATAAEDAWHNELVKQFGKQAGDKRYTKEAKGEPGSKLRQLHDNFSECSHALGAYHMSTECCGY